MNQIRGVDVTHWSAVTASREDQERLEIVIAKRTNDGHDRAQLKIGRRE